MTHDPEATRASLIRAAEECFARDGIDGASAREILRLAGQANDSAINYHFGSRWGLLEAIVAKHVAEMDSVRDVSPGTLEELVRAWVTPAVDQLHTASGRDFLRIVNQVTDRSGARDRALPEAIRGPRLTEQLALVEAELGALAEPLRIERLWSCWLLTAASLAHRASSLEAAEDVQLDHQEYVENLIDMVTAVLRA